MQSNWPDHTPEPGERPSWWGYGAAAAAIAAILIWSPDSGDWHSALQLPEFRLPEFNMPEIALPDFSRDAPSSQSATVSEVLGGTDGPISERQVPFDTCVSMLNDTANRLGQQPFFSVESTNDRQIAVFKFAEGDLTITCSQADGTMTIAQRGS